MRIGRTINVDLGDIEDKKLNYWIGISLGNRYFSKENIQKYTEWAVSNTKDSVLILIADWIYSINLEILDGRNKQSALRKAMSLGETKITEINEIVSAFTPEKINKIKIARWNDVKNSRSHRDRVKIIFEEFNKKTNFHNRVIEIIENHFKNSPKDLIQKDLEGLAGYILNEIPVFLDGIHLFDNTYDAVLYPNIGLVDFLIKDLQEGLVFSELTKKLKIKTPAKIIEAFVD